MSAEKNSPWYVEAFLAVGGWIAGILAAIAIFALAVAVVGDFKNDGADIVAALISLVVGGGFVFAGFSIGGPNKGDFVRHFAIAAIAAGLTAATAGVWYLIAKLFDAAGLKDDIAAGWAGLAAASLLAIAGWILARRMRDGILTFLTTLAVYGVAFLALTILGDRYFLSADFLAPDHILPPLCAFAGAALFLEKRLETFVRPVGAALLIAPMAHFAILQDGRVFGAGHAPAMLALMLGKTALLAAALYCLSELRRRYALAPLVATAILAAAAVWLLPNAGAIAVVMLLAAVAANHRGLSVVGVAALGWFIGRFYYDLSMTLLEKSAVLAAMGAVTIAGALFFRRLSRQHDANAKPAGARRGLLAILGFGALLALSLGLVNRSAMQLEADFREGRDVYFALGPVDPRSLIQGDYMILNFRNDLFPPRETIETLPPSGEVFLRIDEQGVATFSRIPGGDDVPTTDEIRVDYTKLHYGRLRYTPDSYFFQEGEAPVYQPARFAIVRVAPDGKTRLIGLADETFKRLGE